MEILFFAGCQKTKKTRIYVLQTSKSQKNKDLLFANLKNRTKKMDFNFAICVKLAKRILFLGNFEKLEKKQESNFLQTLNS